MEATLYAVYDPDRKKFLRYTEDSNSDYNMCEWVDLHEGVTLEDEITAEALKNDRVNKDKYIVVPVVLTTTTLS